MRMTISEFLEHVDRVLPRGRYRLQAVPIVEPTTAPRARGLASPSYVVHVEDSQTGKRLEFRVEREDLATDARGEWQAYVVARAVKELSAAREQVAAR